MRTASASANLYPLLLSLKDRNCVVVGGSATAERKSGELLDAGARVRLISPDVTPRIAGWAEAGKLQWEARSYIPGDLVTAFLVVAASDAETNARVFDEAEMRHIFCNAVDDIPHCSCYAAAVVRRGPLQIAISTAGNSPALTQRLRKELEERFSEEFGPWVRKLGEIRTVLFQDKTISSETRRKLLHEQADASAYESFCASEYHKSHGSVLNSTTSRSSS